MISMQREPKVLKPHEQRVVDEEDALSVKLNKLTEFIQGEAFSNLPFEDRALLQEQLHWMREYVDVLRRRIARFL
jgi:hypothetical protein